MSRIEITGTIGYEALSENVHAALDASDGTVELYIDSPGGDVLESNAMSLAIAEYAMQHPEKQYTCTVGSLCASAAANILAKLPSCFSVRAYADTLVMYHSCSGLFEGNPQQLKDYAVMMELVNENVIRSLAEKTTLPMDEIKTAFQSGRELWLDARRAQEVGLVAEIIGQSPAEATYTETQAIKQILRMVAEYRTNKQEVHMAEENKAPEAEEEVKPTAETPAEETKAEEIKEEIAEEVAKELDTPPEVDFQAECEKLQAENEELKKELEALKALVAKYTPTAKPQPQVQKKDWHAMMAELNAKPLSQVDYWREYKKLKEDHYAEFEAFMKAHQAR